MPTLYHKANSRLQIFKITSFGSALRALIGWITATLGLYMLAALLGAILPQNGDQTDVVDGRTLYIYDNGVHTSLVLSRSYGDVDLGEAMTQSDVFPGPSDIYPWIMVGWGDREFYLNTPHWKDLSARTAVSALWGSGASLIHIDRLNTLPQRESLRKIVLNEGQYAKLLKFIYPQITIGSNGRPIVLNGYGSDDQFYVSNGREYWALYSCNNWIGEAIANAGVKTGIWTPLPFGIMWWE